MFSNPLGVIALARCPACYALIEEMRAMSLVPGAKTIYLHLLAISRNPDEQHVCTALANALHVSASFRPIVPAVIHSLS
mgnify:CR=1 FL=1